MTAGASRSHVATLHRPWAERIADLLRLGPGTLGVDLPCGEGALTAAMARRGARVLALDTDADAVASCREAALALGLPAVEVRELGEGPPEGAAGAAGSVLTLGNRADPASLLTAAARALRPGGRLAAAVWAAPDAVPPIDALRAALDAVGVAPLHDLEMALSLGAPGALEALAADAGVRGARVHRLRDVARFDGVEHVLTAVSSAHGVEPDLDGLDGASLAALLAELARRLLRWTARDGTLLVPVEAAVLYAETGVE